jgi:hypothetical protein
MKQTAPDRIKTSLKPNDVDVFLNNAAWAICSTYHMVFKASPGPAIFGHDMLIDLPFVADWNKLEITGSSKLILTQHTKQHAS